MSNNSTKTAPNTTSLYSFARDLRKWGAFVTTIGTGKKTLHTWEVWQPYRDDYKPQTEQDFKNLPWNNAVAIGIINGSGDFRFFDIDAPKDENGLPLYNVPESVLETALTAIGLPPDYQWSYRTGSGAGWGFAIRSSEDLPDGKLNSHKKNIYTLDPKPGLDFDHLELRWSSGQTLIYGQHPTGPGYQFRNGTPFVPPAIIPADRIVAACLSIATPKLKKAKSTTSKPVQNGTHSAYGQRALESAAYNVMNALPNTRNTTMFNETCSMAELVNGGELSEDAVRDAMERAARAAGLDDSEIGPSIDSAFNTIGNKARNAPNSSPNGTTGGVWGEDVLLGKYSVGDIVTVNDTSGSIQMQDVKITAILGTAPNQFTGEIECYYNVEGTSTGYPESQLTTPNDTKTTGKLGLKSIPIKDLLDKPFAPLTFLADELIAQGHLVMLGGRPKSGKSWLVLQLAKALDLHQSFLGKSTLPARVLLIALEDGERRVYQRCNIIKWQPKNAHVCFDIAPFDNNGAIGPGLKQIEANAPDFDLIIIDTLIATLSGKANENDNAQMGQVINELARIAHTTDTAILVVHHTGKGQSDNVFDLLRGASALRGGYDVGMLLDRKQDEKEAVLHVESRDVDLSNMTIRQSANGAGWECLGNGSVINELRAGRKVVKAMLEQGDGQTVKELAKMLGVSESAVSAQLNNAEKYDYVKRETADPDGEGRPKDIWYLTDYVTQGGSI